MLKGHHQTLLNSPMVDVPERDIAQYTNGESLLNLSLGIVSTANIAYFAMTDESALLDPKLNHYLQ